MVNNVRTVKFYGNQRGNGEDLFRCKENGRMYIRQECDEHKVRWLSSCKWQGGYEADCPLREGLTFELIDQQGSVVGSETLTVCNGYMDTVADKVLPFSWEALGNISKEVATQNNLIDYEDWSDWLMKESSRFNFKGYKDNWLYDAETIDNVKMEKLSYLGTGTTVRIVKMKMKHRICNKMWWRYEIRSSNLLEVEDLCGFELCEE